LQLLSHFFSEHFFFIGHAPQRLQSFSFFSHLGLQLLSFLQLFSQQLPQRAASKEMQEQKQMAARANTNFFMKKLLLNMVTLSVSVFMIHFSDL